MGLWAHKFFGALGLYNLWGRGFIKFMGPWAHKMRGALGLYNLWGSCVQKVFGAVGS